MPEQDVLIRQQGKAGRITLNRPSSLNAITYAMIKSIYRALVEWQDDDSIHLVVIDAVGDRAFCAGGDLSELYRSGRERNFAYAQSFWQDEYVLNNLIATYPKPYVSVMDKLVLGGGIGLSAHGTRRLVTERTGIAMPECNVGLVPDVGASDLLGQAPGYLGEFIGLSGYRMSGEDAIHAGFADIFVKSEKLPDLIEAIGSDGDISSLDNHVDCPPPSVFQDWQKKIDTVFAGDSMAAILASLAESDADWLGECLNRLRGASPLSVLATLRLIRAARAHAGVHEALRREYRCVVQAMEHGDFLEGIRAAVIDKDKAPNWKYRTIDEVPDAVIDRMLTRPASGDLEL